MLDKIQIQADIKSLSVVNGEVFYKYTQKDIGDMITTISNQKNNLQFGITEISRQISELQQKLDILNTELLYLNQEESNYQQVMNIVSLEK